MLLVFYTDMDLQTFKQQILPVQGRLFRLAKLFLRNREEAEDTLQDVLLKLWTNRQQLDQYHSVEAMAVQMTRNLCLDKLKSHGYARRTDDADLSMVQAHIGTPHQVTESADTVAVVRRLIQELPEQQRLILHLRDVEEYSFEEIEQVTGMSINNIRVALSRARKSVRDSYTKVLNYESSGY